MDTSVHQARTKLKEDCIPSSCDLARPAHGHRVFSSNQNKIVYNAATTTNHGLKNLNACVTITAKIRRLIWQNLRNFSNPGKWEM